MKPFDLRELVARVKSNLKLNSKIITINNIEVDFEKRQFKKD
ncbi:MAG: hypothetical protein Q8S84_01910 [bacterium]|nr:hypothetical protein [bacterium]